MIKNVKLDDTKIKELISLQVMLHGTFGRDRKVFSMGFYDYDKIEGDIYYTAIPAEECVFTPLGSTSEMNSKRILEEHETGKHYAHLVTDQETPVVLKDSNRILSLVPIINSRELGEINSNTKNLFMDMTGTDEKLMNCVLLSIARDFDEEGSTSESVDIHYPDDVLVSPKAFPIKIALDQEKINAILGFELESKETISCLKRTGYYFEGEYVFPLEYRCDVISIEDVAEDIARAYGYNRIPITLPEFYTDGGLNKKSILSNALIQKLTGHGFQQVVNMILTSEDSQEKIKVVESRALGLNSCRSELSYGLLSNLSNNTAEVYPQKLFEIGEVLIENEEKETKIQNVLKCGAVFAGGETSYSQLKGVLEEILKSFGDTEVSFKKSNHELLIKGRQAIFESNHFNGFIGEISLEKLRKFNLEVPVTLFEFTIPYSIE
ncbi:Phenylalanine--tRNA ligase beta subunit [uncultured archaeon]|nr:Phenylalanine--tRNA ligase beta subunit [uncultured archaeon]